MVMAAPWGTIMVPITTDRAILTLAQWLSPAFPLGSFAFSHGLETAINEGHIADATSLRDWLAEVLTHGSGRTDGALLVHVLAGGDPAEADALARALAPAPERADESLIQGRAFLATTNALLGTAHADLTLPVALGLQARSLDLPAKLVVAFYLQNFAANLVLGAVRLIPLGQTEGQRVIADLAPAIEALAGDLAQGGEDALWSSAFGSDLAAMAHEYQEVRLFRS